MDRVKKEVSRSSHIWHDYFNRGINFILSALVFNIFPTIFEVLLVSGILVSFYAWMCSCTFVRLELNSETKRRAKIRNEKKEDSLACYTPHHNWMGYWRQDSMLTGQSCVLCTPSREKANKRLNVTSIFLKLIFFFTRKCFLHLYFE